VDRPTPPREPSIETAPPTEPVAELTPDLALVEPAPVEAALEPVAPVVVAPPATSADYDAALEEARRLRGSRAEAAYRVAIGIQPNGSEALADLAFLLLNRQANGEAEELAARAVAIDPTNSKGWITLGAARQGLGKHAEAMDAYRRCVEVGQGRFVGQCRMMLR
jgi:Flp pilus assembly protein TadD